MAVMPVDEQEQLQQPRLADVIAGVLRTRIVEGQLADGSRLPKQDDLLREFRVSRPSLREALRILEAEGLLVVKRGNVGGSVVRAPAASSAAYTFGLVLQSQHALVGDLAEAIRNVEPVAAALCARREDRQTAVIPRLSAAQQATEEAVGDGVHFTRASRQFHEAFVQACGNTTLIVMLGTLEAMWSQQERQWAQRAQTKGSYPSAEAQGEVIAAHRALLRAIEAGRDEHAARLVQTHLRESQRYTLAEAEDSVVQATPPRSLSNLF
jgi:DNA-binding FadR family transcriptional regulator